MATPSSPSPRLSQGAQWLPWVAAIAGFWLSGTLLLDFLVMPVMYTSGMMTTPDFPAAGYSLFETFNHLEMLCAALILTGLLVLRRPARPFGVVISGSQCRWAVALGTVLMIISLIYTYGLTPEMGALGLSLDAFAPTAELPTTMIWMQGLYWLLEGIKLASLGGILALCQVDLRPMTTVKIRS